MIEVSEEEKKVLKFLVEGLPFCERPYFEIAQKSGLSETKVIQIIKDLKEKGIILRFGITVRHNLLNYQANALVAWKVEPEKIKEVGEFFAALPWVSHCYERRPCKDFPYNFFTMCHAKDSETLKVQLEEVSKKLKIKEFVIMETLEEVVRKHPDYSEVLGE